MRRNERDTTIVTEGGNINPSIALTAEQKSAFVKAMKIGYYKEFYRQGLITAEQLEVLIAMQDRSEHKKAA